MGHNTVRYKRCGHKNNWIVEGLPGRKNTGWKCLIFAMSAERCQQKNVYDSFIQSMMIV